MNENPDDERRMLMEGGQTSFASLFSNYGARLERIINFRLDPRIRGRIDAADVLQEAYLEASTRLPSFLDSANVSFFVWLRQQTLQTLVDVHRRQFRQKRDVNREIHFASTGPSDVSPIQENPRPRRASRKKFIAPAPWIELKAL